MIGGQEGFIASGKYILCGVGGKLSRVLQSFL